MDERKPDLILIAGDIIDTDVSLIRYDYTKDFQKIKAPLGVYASVGNHEYYGDFNKNLEYIKNLGINILYEDGKEVATRPEFYLVGAEGNILEWTKWDLSALGKVVKIDFNVTGSNDNGYGFSQPAYFAYDDVAVRF